MKCSIILVGTELLSGATVDTNSIYMAQELNKYGIEIKYKLIVRDEIEDIISALEFSKKTCDLLILSGGLGPTLDDLTKEAIGKYQNKKLLVDEEELKELREKFKNLGIEFLENNLKEIEKPEGAISFKNDVGMAPAFYSEGIVAFPGVPRELKNMFPKFLKWYNENIKKGDPIYIKDILTYGLPESHLEKAVKDLFVEPGIDYEFLVKDYGILIRLQSKVSNKNRVEKILEKIYNRIDSNIFGEDTERLESLVIERLKKLKYKISTAESCTGGLVASKLISVPGASEVFMEGMVTYSNLAKEERLNVKKEIIEKYGAVSEEVAKEMVLGLHTDVGISITGIAGPSGGTEEKPVGLVYIGLRIKEDVYIKKMIFKGDREKIRNKSVLHSLFELNKILKKDVKQ
ncbi:competence/damage-inducible protein A [Cetobacterium sp. SF1]|uniref:competence/damage-inducible protein A n=1 Tax=unclassified Cetobacterium TaxID=2630983 RepID=UPI003CF46F72